MPIANTCSIGYPHDGRADNAAYRHDRRADKRRYRHDRRADSLSLPVKERTGTCIYKCTKVEVSCMFIVVYGKEGCTNNNNIPNTDFKPIV